MCFFSVSERLGLALPTIDFIAYAMGPRSMMKSSFYSVVAECKRYRIGDSMEKMYIIV